MRVLALLLSGGRLCVKLSRNQIETRTRNNNFDSQTLMDLVKQCVGSFPEVLVEICTKPQLSASIFLFTVVQYLMSTSLLGNSNAQEHFFNVLTAFFLRLASYNVTDDLSHIVDYFIVALPLSLYQSSGFK